jgi:ketosteroid isomerase-like protein
MADKATIMREFVNALAMSDGEKLVSYVTDDSVWVGPGFNYKGKEGIKNYAKALSQSVKEAKVTESGNGIIINGDKAFFEHIISGTYQGKKFEYLAMCSYEFSGDKIKAMRTTSDRLGLAQQVAGGWFSRWMVNAVVNQVEKPFKSAK